VGCFEVIETAPSVNELLAQFTTPRIHNRDTILPGRFYRIV
jgi:hypothetical protein